MKFFLRFFVLLLTFKNLNAQFSLGGNLTYNHIGARQNELGMPSLGLNIEKPFGDSKRNVLLMSYSYGFPRTYNNTAGIYYVVQPTTGATYAGNINMKQKVSMLIFDLGYGRMLKEANYDEGGWLFNVGIKPILVMASNKLEDYDTNIYTTNPSYAVTGYSAKKSAMTFQFYAGIGYLIRKNNLGFYPNISLGSGDGLNKTDNYKTELIRYMYANVSIGLKVFLYNFIEQ